MTHGKSTLDVKLKARQTTENSAAYHKSTSIFKAQPSQSLFTFKKIN
jgi:hypothetical protein